MGENCTVPVSVLATAQLYMDAGTTGPPTQESTNAHKEMLVSDNKMCVVHGYKRLAGENYISSTR